MRRDLLGTNAGGGFARQFRCRHAVGRIGVESVETERSFGDKTSLGVTGLFPQKIEGPRNRRRFFEAQTKRRNLLNDIVVPKFALGGIGKEAEEQVQQAIRRFRCYRY